MFKKYTVYIVLLLVSPVVSSFFRVDSELSNEKKIKDIIVLENENKPISEREAILILPGLGDSKKGRASQKAFFAYQGFDLFIPNYINRDSFNGCVENLKHFYKKHHLLEYKKVHVFSYILGSWVLNSFITENEITNISSIVYNRSPLQERAPRIIVERIPRIGKLKAGNLVKELSLISYSPIPKGNRKLGIIVESKATPLIKFFKKTAMSYGSIDWKNLDYKQDHDDLIYTRLDHNEMYYSFDEIGDDILYFFRKGSFLDSARRVHFDWDPFKKYKPQK